MIIYYHLSWFWVLTWLSWLVVAPCLSCGFRQMVSLSYFDGFLIHVSHDGCWLSAGTSVGAVGQNTYRQPLYVDWVSAEHGGQVPRTVLTTAQPLLT